MCCKKATCLPKKLNERPGVDVRVAGVVPHWVGWLICKRLYTYAIINKARKVLECDEIEQKIFKRILIADRIMGA